MGIKYYLLKILFVVVLILSTQASNAQYCDAGPSSSADSQLEWLSFTGVLGTINFTGCPTSTTGLEEFLGTSATVNAGDNYNISMQFGTCGGNYSGVGEVWIDFNQDYNFTLDESIGTWQGIPPTSQSDFNFSVPVDAVNGLTRMRVIQYENGSLPINACSSFTWGSATDFSIVIQNGIDCTGFIGDNMNDPRLVSAFPFSESYNTSLCYSNQNQVYISPDVYYMILPNPAMQSLQISLCGSSFDTFLTVTDAQGNIIETNDDYSPCGISSQIDIVPLAEDTLFAIVEGWGQESGDYTITIGESNVGLQENSFDFDIFPNPSNGLFEIVCGQEMNYQLYSSHGHQIDQGILSIGQHVINLNQHPKGVYYIALYNKKTVQSVKLIKLND